MLKSSGVKLHLLGIGLSFCWSPIHDDNAWNLRQFNIDRVTILLNVVKVSMPQQVSIPLILFLIQKFSNQVLVGDQKSRVDRRGNCLMSEVRHKVLGPRLNHLRVECLGLHLLLHAIKLQVS